MKKLTTLIVLSFSAFLNVIAQNELNITLRDKTYTEGFDSIIANVSKDSILTGVLYDRVIPWSNLTSFTDSSKVTSDGFYQSWHELFNATYTNSRLKTSEQLQLKSSYYAQYDTLTLGAINYNYNTIAFRALADSILIVHNSLLYDGLFGNPYDTKNICFGTLLYSEIVKRKNYYIKFDSDAILQNDTNTIKKISLIVNSNGQDYLLNGVNVISFSDTGLYRLTIKTVKSNADVTTVFQDIYVTDGLNKKGVLSSLCIPESPKIVIADIPYNGYNGNLKGQADVTIFYHADGTGNCEYKMKKPIIILDGFDYQNKLKANVLYQEYLSYFDGAVGVQVGDSLRRKGYDIIVFNPIIYPNAGALVDGGVDYVQRNAYTLIKLINQINDSLVTNNSTEKIVIIGPSMGGQISRYALTYMEQNSMPHNSRLWVSFDSPHHGANVPMAAQHYIKFFGLKVGIASAQATLHGNILSPVSQQLLINQTQYLGGINNNYYNNSNPERMGWINTLNTSGFPTQTRNIALINGSSAGGYFHNPSSTMYNFLLMSPVLPNINGYANGYFIPKNLNTSDVFNGKIQFCLPLLFWNICFSIYSENSSYSNTDVKSAIDACPGGLYDIQDELKDEGTSINNWVASYFPNLTHDASFIPSISALAFTNSNFDWKTKFDDRNLVCTNEIPFDNYYAPIQNESHVTITKPSYQWLLQEITKGHKGTDCPTICADGLLGANLMCSAMTELYDLNDMIQTQYFPYVSTIWTCSAGLTISGFPFNPINTASVTAGTVTATSQEWIKATIVNPCGNNVEIIRYITVTPATPTMFLNRTPYFNCQSFVVVKNAANTPVYGATYEYSTDGVNYAPNPNGPGHNSMIYPYVNTPFSVWCKMTTLCEGLLPIIYSSFSSLNNPNCNQKTDQTAPTALENLRIDAYPNPTSNKWNIMLYNFVLTNFVSAKLFDITGKTVWTGRKTDFSNSNIEIPAYNLAIGTYSLQIITDKQSETFKLIKK